MPKNKVHMVTINSKVILLLICTLGFVSSCSQDDDHLLTGRQVAAVFTPGFPGDGDAETRATDNTWTSGDRVGIYMVKNTNYALASALSSNVEYNAPAGTSVTLSAVGTPIYYPVNGDKVRFVAYYPYNVSATSNNQVTYTFTTQNTKATKEGTDFLFHKGTTDYDYKSLNAALAFKHKFSKVNITVKQGFEGPSCNDLTMTLTNMPISATVNLGTLATDENSIAGLGISTSSTTISGYTSDSDVTGASIEAIVAPHTGSGNFTNRTFTFSIAGYTYSPPDDVTFESGKVYNYEFTLTKTAAILDDVHITNWEIGEVQWNTIYALATSTSTHEVAYNTTSSKLIIRTKGDPATVPTIARSTTNTSSTSGPPDWLTNATLGTASTSGDWTTRTLTVTTQANSGSTASRTGYIWLSFQGLTCIITVNQSGVPDVKPASADGMSNCYIVAPGGTVIFRVTRAYTGGVLRDNYSSSFAVEVLWQDAACINAPTVSGSGKTATIKVTATAPGNALVALRAGGAIVWSYHIWVSDIDTANTWEADGNSTNPRKTFMDRNLGATANTLSIEGRGLFYQWGRKDPFPAKDITGFYLGSQTGAVSLETSIRVPNVFYAAESGAASDWLTPQNDFLWCTADDKKTIYDPCPAGWRVPTSGPGTDSPWSGLTFKAFTSGDAGGVNWGTYANWPAPGYRTYGSGGLSSVGGEGYYWCATLNSAGGNGHTMYLNTKALQTTHQSARTNGRSVRCVQE